MVDEGKSQQRNSTDQNSWLESYWRVMSSTTLSATAASNEQLRDPREEVRRAAIVREWGCTANLIRDAIQRMIEEWYGLDGHIRTAMQRYDRLDIERMERSGEAWVYDVKGDLIMIHCRDEVPIPLLRIDDSFGEYSRRMINRHLEKIDAPSTRGVDRRLRSFMFWEDVAIKISGKLQQLK